MQRREFLMRLAAGGAAVVAAGRLSAQEPQAGATRADAGEPPGLPFIGLATPKLGRWPAARLPRLPNAFIPTPT